MSSALSLSSTSHGLLFNCELKEVLVLDKCTLSPNIPAILAVPENANYRHFQYSQHRDEPNSLFNALHSGIQKPTLSICFESKSGKSQLKIFALPIELSLNRTCVNTLLNAFSRPKNAFSVAAAATRPKPVARSALSVSSVRNIRKKRPPSAFEAIIARGSDDLEIIFEASAPKIIIPEDCAADRGYLLLDTGHIAMHGFIGSGGMELSISLSDINAGLPISVFDKYNLGAKSLYLIKVPRL
jgi:hypothetical protein